KSISTHVPYTTLFRSVRKVNGLELMIPRPYLNRSASPLQAIHQPRWSALPGDLSRQSSCHCDRGHKSLADYPLRLFRPWPCSGRSEEHTSELQSRENL